MDGEKYMELTTRYLKALTEEERQQVLDYLDALDHDGQELVMETGLAFYKSSAVNSTWFWKVLPVVASRLAPDQLKTWLAEGTMICRGSWECGLSFLKTTPDILNILAGSTFLNWVQVGRVLVRYSNHEANWYFKNSDSILCKLETEERSLLISWVQRILEHSWKAAAACFKNWPEISGYLSNDEKTEALEAGLGLAADFCDDADTYFAYLPLFLQKAGADLLGRWMEATYVMKGIRRGVLSAFLSATPRLLDRIERDEVAAKLKAIAILGQGLAPKETGLAEEFFDKAPLALKYIEWPELEIVVDLIEDIDREFCGQGAIDFVSHLPELLQQLDVRELREWVRNGLRINKVDQRNVYFAVKSQESRDAISRLRSGLYVEAVKKVLLLYCEGLTGEAIIIRNSSDLPGGIHGDDRLFGTLDTRRLYLPDVVKVFDNERDNLRFYRVMLMHLMAHRQFASFALNIDDIKELAVNRYLGVLFEYIEDNRVDYLALKHNPGLIHDIKLLLQTQEMAARTQQPGNPILSYLKNYFTVHGLGLDHEEPSELPDVEVRNKVSQYWSKVVETGASAKDSLILAHKLLKALLDTGISLKQVVQAKNIGYRGQLRFDLVYMAMKLDLEIAENEAAATTQTALAKGDDHLEPFDEARLAADGLEVNLNSDFYVWLKKLLNKFYDDEQNPYRMIAYYDEWDRTLNDYKKDWCKVREILLKPSSGLFVTQTLEEHYGMISNLKRYFGMLRPDRFQRYYRQEDGEDIDIDAVVEAMIEKNAGVSPNDGFYVRRDKRERDVAVGFLLDLSYSTEEVIAGTGKTLLDVEKESVIVMSEALEVLGDKYGIYGFNSDGRDKINFYVVKDFDETYTFEVKQRFGGLQSYGMTRLASAIRHAVYKMERVSAAIKILIILSDGRPFDFDYKSGAIKEDFEKFYAETDTRMALREAKMRGVNPFCITVDTKGQEYLEYIFGNVSYIIIDDVNALPTKLTETYKNLTT